MEGGEAISECALAGALPSSVSSEPEECCPTFPSVTVTRHNSGPQKALCHFPPPETTFHWRRLGRASGPGRASLPSEELKAGHAVSGRCPQTWRSRAEVGTLWVRFPRSPASWTCPPDSGGLCSAGRGRGLWGNWPRLPSPVPFLGCRKALQKNLGKLPRNSRGRFWTNLGKQGKGSAGRWPVSCTETTANDNREGPGWEEQRRREGHMKGAQESTGASPPPAKSPPPSCHQRGSPFGETEAAYFLAESNRMSLSPPSLGPPH